MKALRFASILLGGLILLLLSGCAAEDGDLTPPDAAYDGGVPSPTTLTSVILTGTMDTDALILADATLPAIAVVTDRDNILGTWECTVTNMVHGPNIILVSATDPIGNTRTLTITIMVDLIGPVTTILQYPEFAQAGSFSFAGTVDEAGSTVSVEVFDSGGLTTGISGAASVDADIWNVDLNLSALADGDYTVIATGTDLLGNDSVTPAEQLITLSLTSQPFAIASPTLPVVLDTDVDQQVFVGTTTPLSNLAVTPSTAITQPDAIGDWDATVSGFVGGNTIVSFDVDNGSTIQKVLVVRDQMAPTVVEWTSTTSSTVTVEFNESMNAATILPENLLIEDSKNETTFIVLSVAPVNDRTFTFTTTVPLPLGESYTATLQTPQLPTVCSIVDGCTVEDARGNGLAATFVWRFNK